MEIFLLIRHLNVYKAASSLVRYLKHIFNNNNNNNNNNNIGTTNTKSKFGFSIQKLHHCICGSVVCTTQNFFMNTPNTFPVMKKKLVT